MAYDRFKTSVSYVLVINVLKRIVTSIKSLGTVTFEPGTYIYIGSANVKNPLARVLRHFRKDKKIKWHIDYLTTAPEVRIQVAITCYGLAEDSIYEVMLKQPYVSVALRKFGSTDRRGHLTHLFKLGRRHDMLHLIDSLLRKCKCVEIVAD